MFSLAEQGEELLRDPLSAAAIAFEELDAAQACAAMLVTRGAAGPLQVVAAPASGTQVIRSDMELALLVDLLDAERRLGSGVTLN
jgi:hypothetical protein